MRVNLHSNVDGRLLFSVPVHASIVAARPSHRYASSDSSHRQSTSHLGVVPPSTPTSPHVTIRKGLPIPSSYLPEAGESALTDNQLDRDAEIAHVGVASQWQRNENREWNSLRSLESRPLSSSSVYDPQLTELFGGSPALKDAPGMRSNYHQQHSPFVETVEKHFAKNLEKDIVAFVDRPNADSSLSEASLKLGGSGSVGDVNLGGSGHRPALELIMYILLGLFVLIALIFAVNCGAMVARYRWEHERSTKETLRLQQLSELAMSNANTDVAGTAECSSSSTADVQSQGDRVDTLERVEVQRDEATSTPAHSGCIGALAMLRGKLVLRSLSHQRMNRDNDWVWLGRDALAERQGETLIERLASTPTTDSSKHAEFSQTTSSARGTTHLFVAKSAQGLSFDDRHHGGTFRAPASRKIPAPSCSTCHYKGDECSIRILTNATEPVKSTNPTEVPVLQQGSNTGHHLMSGPRRNTHQSQPGSCRRSMFTFGQSLIIDRQNPNWQFPIDSTFHHLHQHQMCYCSKGAPSPWVYRRVPTETSEPSVAVDGYQTLPTNIPVWHDEREGDIPPSPPRPAQQPEPSLATSATNAVYSLLGGDDTLIRQSSIRLHRQHQQKSHPQTKTDFPRRTRSYSRIDAINNEAEVSMCASGSQQNSSRLSTCCPIEIQSVMCGNYRHEEDAMATVAAYFDCGPPTVPTPELHSSVSESIS
ncbi:unnamed protein product [Mesocestoides corti]|uniref:Uncharacterized protein n=1 Tax=Mesocestoides corti TaxID=53468 RepID=A0A3P6IB65_MESCO|nr:unnamed protein product [Mesocestoides corti]